MNYLLEVDSINKSYNGKIILSNVYLKCEINNIVGVFGRNGSGKSTLLKIIFGVLPAENKFIRINGIVENEAYKIRDGISYLNQDNFIPFHFSVLKAIKLTIDKTKIEEFINDDLIRKNLRNRISSLSGGESKYLHVKIVLFSNTKFCLLDEPYSGVSPIIVEKINNLILEQSKTKGIIITDHNYQSLLKVANKFFLLKDGSGYHLKDKEELIQHGYLNSDMLD
jgi:ABC-type lipopolysaccharide export system ATPase subunit